MKTILLYNSNWNDWSFVSIVLAGSVILFLALRELTCWYFKINERIKLQKETNALLRSIAGHGSESGSSTLSPMEELERKRKAGEITEQDYQRERHKLIYQ